jgi:hypothetical protein
MVEAGFATHLGDYREARIDADAHLRPHAVPRLGGGGGKAFVDRDPARQALSGTSSSASRTPNSAMIPSPVKSLTEPPCSRTVLAIRS